MTDRISRLELADLTLDQALRRSEVLIAERDAALTERDVLMIGLGDLIEANTNYEAHQAECDDDPCHECDAFMEALEAAWEAGQQATFDAVSIRRAALADTDDEGTTT